MVFYQLYILESREYYVNDILIMYICMTYSIFYSHSD